MKSGAGQPGTIDEYIAGFPPDVQKILTEMRTRIREVVPEAEEAMKYQLPTFVLNGNLVHFGAFRNHIGFYPTPSAIRAFTDELSRYETAKGSIRFPLSEPMPWGLIEKIVSFRVKETQSRDGHQGHSSASGGAS